MLVFPMQDAAGHSTISARPSLSTRVFESRASLVPSHAHLVDLLRLLKSAFANVRAESLHGHAAVVLVDQHDHRYKRTTAAARNGSTKKEPFDTLVCAWSDQEHVIRFRQSMFDSAHSNAMLCAFTRLSVFDVQQVQLKGNSHHVIRICYFATVEEFAGRGYAKLLLTHIKTIAARLATDSNKEATLVVISLEHTVPFWCSDGMGFLRGGDTARTLAHLNMADTTLADTRQAQASCLFLSSHLLVLRAIASLCTQAVPLGTVSLHLYLSERSAALASVRQKRLIPKEDLKMHPRYPQKVIDLSKGDVKGKTDQKTKQRATNNRSTSAAPTKKKTKQKQASKEAGAMEIDYGTAAPVLPPEPTIEYSFLRGPPLPRTVVPFLTPASEWRNFWPLIALVKENHVPLELPGKPPVQHVHLAMSDFKVDEILVAAILELRSPGAPPMFHLERVKLLRPCPTHSYSWEVQLVDRTDQRTAASVSGRTRPRNNLALSTAPEPAVRVVFCAVVPTCFLYKEHQGGTTCPLHKVTACCRP
jgi:hypothetical protein